MFTTYGYKINLIDSGDGFNWLFLPGGPGLGSEYLEDFCAKLDLPGSKYLVDFPMDGSNTEGKLDILHWKNGLIDLCKKFGNVILVTHSFSGMFVLSIPEIEKFVKGVVFMNTTIADTFFTHIENSKKRFNLPDLTDSLTKYHNNPTHEELKSYWEVYKYYCHTKQELTEGEKLGKKYIMNNVSYNFGIANFYPNYKAQWAPSTIPALTITSEQDYICPPDIFTMDERFTKENIMNVVITNAGHVPWLLHFDKIQSAFDKYCDKFTF